MTDTFKIAISKYSLDHKIPQGSDLWPKFNSSFENRETDTEHLMEAVYKGQPITTWHKDHWRTSNNFICGQSIGLDFDTEDSKSTIKALIKDKFISRYAAFVHTTISHTDEKPRSRALFVLDVPIQQAKNYVLAASALLWLFGTADRACRDAVRFWYGSKKCQFEYINSVLPLDIIKKLIAQYQDTGGLEKKRAVRPGYFPPASQQEVSAALKFIPPWQIDYDEWVQVLMGIHAEFGEGGYMLADSWGDGKGDEIEKKWKSFKANEPGGVTIATVFAIAKRFGWSKRLDNVV